MRVAVVVAQAELQRQPTIMMCEQVSSPYTVVARQHLTAFSVWLL